jgi:hypothetical protein
MAATRPSSIVSSSFFWPLPVLAPWPSTGSRRARRRNILPGPESRQLRRNKPIGIDQGPGQHHSCNNFLQSGTIIHLPSRPSLRRRRRSSAPTSGATHSAPRALARSGPGHLSAPFGNRQCSACVLSHDLGVDLRDFGLGGRHGGRKGCRKPASLALRRSAPQA